MVGLKNTESWQISWKVQYFHPGIGFEDVSISIRRTPQDIMQKKKNLKPKESVKCLYLKKHLEILKKTPI